MRGRAVGDVALVLKGTADAPPKGNPLDYVIKLNTEKLHVFDGVWNIHTGYSNANRRTDLNIDLESLSVREIMAPRNESEVAPMLDLDEQGRPTWLFGRTVQHGCGRAGFAEQGEFARTPADARGCLVKLGCKGPVAKCNVPIRGWVGGVGGCPNVGGICTACTMPGFPDKFMPFMEANRLGTLAAVGARFTYGPVLRRLRHTAIRRHYDVEPDWRAPGEKLSTGYDPGW